MVEKTETAAQQSGKDQWRELGFDLIKTLHGMVLEEADQKTAQRLREIRNQVAITLVVSFSEEIQQAIGKMRLQRVGVIR